ncbi:MAG: hypothetical protein AAB692_03125 [Patescibacteria group bacterium]
MDPVTVTWLAALLLAGFACGLKLAFPAVTALILGCVLWLGYWCIPWRRRHQDVALAHVVIGLYALPFMLPMLVTAFWIRMHVVWTFDVSSYDNLRDFFLR